MSTDEEKWEARFRTFAAIRMWGLVAVVAGLMLAFRNPLGDEIPIIGSALIIAGVAIGLLGPRWMRRRWADEDRR